MTTQLATNPAVVLVDLVGPDADGAAYLNLLAVAPAHRGTGPATGWTPPATWALTSVGWCAGTHAPASPWIAVRQR
jgi:hypothetical protein